MTTALLVVDVQRALVEGETAVPGAGPLLERLRGLLTRARAVGVPVVHVQDHGDELTRPGTPGWDLVLDVVEGEPVVAKSGDDGFSGTELDGVLRAAGVDRLVVVGIQSEMCVAATARGALAGGYRVALPRDGHATYDVPDGGPTAPGVPAELVARVAEWSLGDGIETPDVSDVSFS